MTNPRIARTRCFRTNENEQKKSKVPEKMANSLGACCISDRTYQGPPLSWANKRMELANKTQRNITVPQVSGGVGRNFIAAWRETVTSAATMLGSRPSWFDDILVSLWFKKHLVRDARNGASENGLLTSSPTMLKRNSRNSRQPPFAPRQSSENKYSRSALDRLRAKPSSPNTSAIVFALLCCSSQIFSSTVPGEIKRYALTV